MGLKMAKRTFFYAYLGIISTHPFYFEILVGGGRGGGRGGAGGGGGSRPVREGRWLVGRGRRLE